MKDGPSPDLSPKETIHACDCMGRGEGFRFVAGGKASSISPPTTGTSRVMNFGETAGVRGQHDASAS